MTALALAPSELKSIVDEVWGSLLNPTPVDAEHLEVDSDLVAGYVEISGGWFGRVSVETTDEGAFALASQMLDVPVDDLSDADLVDAVGELANIVGGSVKSCVEGHSTLSLPAVARAESEGRLNLTMQVVSRWLEHPLRVRVLSAA
ncbi:MAG: chemotaxis protein CheX [Candidatus Nanopelagicales bacterium]